MTGGRRSALAGLCFAGLLAAAVTGVAHGAPGDTFHVAAGGNLDWIPDAGATNLTSSEPLDAEDTFSGTFGSAPYSLHALAGAARARLSGSYENLFFSSRFDPNVAVLARTLMTVSGPAGPVQTALRVHVDGTFQTSCGASAICDAYAAVFARAPGLEVSTQVDRNGTRANSLGLAIDSVAGGFHVHGDVTTAPFTVTTGEPFFIQLDVQLITSSRPAALSTFDLDFSDGITFAPTGPVLQLPAGYDANGTGVVGDRWIQGSPTAAFTATPANADCGAVIHFDGSASAASAGRTIARYTWDFGDGSPLENTSTPTVDHKFQALGQFHPTLVVYDDLGVASDPATTTARSLDRLAPVAAIAGPASYHLGDTATFDGSASTDSGGSCAGHVVLWTWSLDGGAPIETSGPTISAAALHVPAALGTHTLTLVVSDDAANEGAPATFAFSVLSPIPTASLSVTPASPSCAEAVVLDGSASTATGGRAIAEYIWDFGDGSGTVVTRDPVVSVTHTYPGFGVFHPTLRVSDEDANVSGPATAVVNSSDRGSPTAIIHGPTMVLAGATIQFDGSGSSDAEAPCGSRIVDWVWTLDAGSPVVRHTPTISGTQLGSLAIGAHVLTLEVVDDSGNRSLAATLAFRVVTPPVAAITAVPTLPTCGQSVAFDGSGSSADPALHLVRWTWDPGDGSGLVERFVPTFAHAYATLGRYTASLVVTDDQTDRSAPATIDITVRDLGLPTAAFTAPSTMAAGQPVTFDGSASNDPEQACGSHLIRWTWSVDAGSPVQTTTPTIAGSAFAAQLTPGSHTIRLTVTDDSGNQSAPVTRSIVVTAATGTIQLAVDTAPDSGISIVLTGPPALGATSLDGSPTTALPASKSFTGLSAGSYAVVQSATTGLAVVRITCTDPDGGSVVNIGARSATIDLDPGETVVCTFTSVVTSSAPVAAGGLQSLGFSAAQAAPLLKGFGFTATQVAPTLTSVFSQSIAQATGLLRGVGYTPQDVMTALKTGLGQTAAQATAAFKAAGFTPPDVAASLRDVFNRTPNQVSTLMKDALYTASEVGSALQAGLGLGAAAAVTAMKAAGFDAPAALSVLMDVYHLTVQIGVPILASANYTLTQVVTAARVTALLTPAAVASLIKPIAAASAASAAAAATAVVIALANGFSVGADVIVPAMVVAAYNAVDVAFGLKGGLGATASDVALALIDAFPSPQVAVALRDAFNRTPSQVAKLMKDAQYTSTQVAVALRDGLALGQDAAAAAMKFAGYEAQVTLARLMDVYHLTAQIGVPILATASYALTEVVTAARVALLTPAAVASLIKPIAAASAATAAAAATAVVISLANGFQAGATIIVPAMVVAGYNAVDLAAGLKGGLGAAAGDVAADLIAAFPSSEVAVALRDVFNRSANQVAKLMKDANYTSTQVAAAMRDGLALGQDAAAAALKFAGYEAEVTLARLMDVYHLTVQIGTPILANAHYTLTQVATAARVAGGLGAGAVASLIKPIAAAATTSGAAAASAVVSALAGAFSAGAPVIVPAMVTANYSASEVAAGLKGALGAAGASEGMVAVMAAFGLSPGDVAQLFRDAGFTSTAIATALNAGVGLGPAAAAQILFDIQYALPTIGSRLQDSLGAQAGEAAGILFDLQATSTQIANMLHDAFQRSASQAAEILDDLDYSPSTIAKRLHGVFDKDPGEVAEILHDDLDFGATKIAEAMKGISQNATETVTILKDLHYGIETLVRILDEEFQKGPASIQTILLGLDYSLTDILDAIRAVLGV